MVVRKNERKDKKEQKQSHLVGAVGFEAMSGKFTAHCSQPHTVINMGTELVLLLRTGMSYRNISIEVR